MYTKEGFPETGDFVIVTVRDTSQHSATFDLDEYKDLDGTVTSSEMSRKWARNIKIFIKPGRKMICKVLKIDQEHKHIDLSIKRVGSSQAQTKQKDWNNEKRADDLVVAMSKALNIKYGELFEKIARPILNKYDLIYPFLLEVLNDESIAKELNLDKDLEDAFVNTVKLRIKRRKAKVTGVLKLSSFDPNGLSIVKDAISTLKSEVEKGGDEIEIKYLGAPRYKIVFESPDLKHGENNLMDVLRRIEKHIKKQDGSIEFKKSTS